MSQTVSKHGAVLAARQLKELRDSAMRSDLIDSSIVLRLIDAVELQHTQIFGYLDTIASLKTNMEAAHTAKIAALVEVEKLQGRLDKACKVLEEVSNEDTGTGDYLEDLCRATLAEIRP